MNQSDDHQLDLHDQLVRAIGDEPVMRSLPEDDLARGRRLVRRRRFAAVTAATAAVPALALGGWALSANLGAQSATGPGTVRMAPAGESGQTSASDGRAMTPLPGGCASVSGGDSLVGSGAGGMTAGGDSVRARPGGLSIGSGRLSVGGPSGTQSDPACDGVASAIPLGTVSGECDPTTPPPSDATADCVAVTGDPIDTPEVDRVTAVLQHHLDPDGTHSGGALLAGGSVGDQDRTTAVYVAMNWSDGDLGGVVDVSVEDSSMAGPDTQCQDQSLPNGPQVTCVEQTLTDGATVLVGHGQQDGAERVTVRYDRPDGTVVIATADQATEQWWTDGSGPAPLTAPPATVDQLIDLVLDPGNHL